MWRRSRIADANEPRPPRVILRGYASRSITTLHRSLDLARQKAWRDKGASPFASPLYSRRRKRLADQLAVLRARQPALFALAQRITAATVELVEVLGLDDIEATVAQVLKQADNILVGQGFAVAR